MDIQKAKDDLAYLNRLIGALRHKIKADIAYFRLSSGADEYKDSEIYKNLCDELEYLLDEAELLEEDIYEQEQEL